MRVVSVIVVVLMLSSAAIAENEGEETRDLPLPSMSAPATGGGNPPPEHSLPRERAGPARAQTHCHGEWICGRLRYRANDSYAPGSYVYGLQAGGRWVEGPCRKERRC